MIDYCIKMVYIDILKYGAKTTFAEKNKYGNYVVYVDVKGRSFNIEGEPFDTVTRRIALLIPVE